MKYVVTFTRWYYAEHQVEIEAASKAEAREKQKWADVPHPENDIQNAKMPDENIQIEPVEE